jgi:hypothetical protein
MVLRKRGEYTAEVDGAMMRFARTAEVGAIIIGLARQLAIEIRPDIMAGLLRGLGQSLLGWSGVTDEDGADVPPTQESWETLITQRSDVVVPIIVALHAQLGAEIEEEAKAEGSDPPPRLNYHHVSGDFDREDLLQF